MERVLLTTGEVAKYCGVNFRTVIRWIERGHLKAYKLPGRGDNRIEIPDFIDFLNENNMPVPEALKSFTNKVLVVEDDSAMANAIRRVLHRQGFEVMVASDGFQAGAMLSGDAPTIMTLDLNMPGLHGLEVLRFVKESERLRHVKILVVSAETKDKLNEALQYGADAVLEKPFTDEQLVESILRLTKAKPKTKLGVS